jgi:hypothetical protein
VAHRERSEPMCRVGGVSGSEVFAHLRALPPPGASRHPPHKGEGQERKSFAGLDPTRGREKEVPDVRRRSSSLPREAVCRRTRCLFSLPCEAVGRVAHRERSERCVGWGCFREFPMSTAIALNRPPPRPPADPPHASRGRDKKERAATRPCSLVGGVRSLRAIVPHLQQSRDNRSRSPKLALRLLRSNDAGKFSRG